MAKNLRERGVDVLVVVGGDGTLRGAHAIAEACGSTTRVVAVPKTIDNDIPLVDRSFGFDSAVAEARRAIETAVVEAEAFPRGLGVVRLMGRDAGFLAVHAALAAPGEVDAVLVPEKSFDVDRLFDYLDARLRARDRAVVVVAEGVKTPARLAETDGTTTPLPDVGAWLADRAARHFRDVRGAPISLKYVDPSYAVRAGAPNAADTILCARLATHAVHAAFAGYTDCAVATVNAQFALIPLAELTSRASIVAVAGHLWGDLVRSTGQPDFVSPRRRAPSPRGVDDQALVDERTESEEGDDAAASASSSSGTPPDATEDLLCDADEDGDFRESPSGGCVVAYDS